MVRAGLMEKNMSKGNESSKLGRATQVRELRDDELQQVSGGDIRIGSIHSTITTIDGPGLLSPGVLKVLVESIVDQLNQPRMG